MPIVRFEMPAGRSLAQERALSWGSWSSHPRHHGRRLQHHPGRPEDTFVLFNDCSVETRAQKGALHLDQEEDQD